MLILALMSSQRALYFAIYVLSSVEELFEFLGLRMISQANTYDMFPNSSPRVEAISIRPARVQGYTHLYYHPYPIHANPSTVTTRR